MVKRSNNRKNNPSKKLKPRLSAKKKSSPSPFTSFTLHDLLKDKHLEIVTAALLLSGKLKVDSVQLFRGSPIIQVNLLGQFISQGASSDKSNALAKFLEDNGDMTIDDIIDAFQKRMKKNGRRS